MVKYKTGGGSPPLRKGEKKMATVYEIINEKIIDALEKGVSPWEKPWIAHKNLKSGNTYRGMNQWLLQLDQRSTPYWLTYKQAQELGGNVKKGEKGSMVIFYKSYKRKGDGEDEPDRRCLRYYKVFNLDQIEGIAAPIAHEENQTAEEVIDGMKKAPTISFRGLQPCYIPSKDEIEMPDKSSFPEIDEYYSTMFHELVHSTGHKSRLDRGLVGNTFQSKDKYGFEELVAEMGAAYLCGVTGIEVVKHNASYIKGWADIIRADKMMILKAAAAAQKAVDLILNK